MKKDINCWKCSKPFTSKDDYMLKDSVWNQVLPFRSSLWFIKLHIDCFEKLLGRETKEDDFTKMEDGSPRTPGYYLRMQGLLCE